MCPEYALRRQRGFLMPLAVFIIVIMGGLALTMSRTVSQSNTSVIQTAIAMQAFYAADSGAQWGMNRLFYNAGTPLSRAAVDASCAALTGQSLNFATDGLRNCNVQLQCARTIDASDTSSYYLISSAAHCGSAPIDAQRTVEVSAFMR